MDYFSQHGAADSQHPGVSANVVGKRTFGEDGDFGFVVAASAHDDHSSEIYNNAGTYSVVNGIDIPAGAQEHGNFDVYDHGYSVLGKLEARSTDRLYGFIAANLFKEVMDQNNSRGSLALAASSITDATESAGNFTNGVAQAYSREYDINRRVLTITSGLDYALTDRSKASVVASYGDSNHDETLYQGSIFRYPHLSGSYAVGSNGVAFDLAPNSGLGNPANWSVTPSSPAVITHLPMTDRIYTFRGDYNYNDFAFSDGLGFAGGVALRRLHRVFNQSADNYTLPAGSSYTLDQALAGHSGSAFDGSSVAFVDFDRYWSYVSTNGRDALTTSPTSSFNLTEDVAGAYTALYFSTDKLKSLAGVRYEYTHENDSTAQLDGTTPVPFDFTRHYDYFLPNVQASYNLLEGLRLRAAYTETIARPTFTTFAQGLTINNFSSLTPFIRGSNPNLTARESSNVDVSLELYRPQGYLSLAGFHKNISHEVYFLTNTVTDSVTGTVTQIVTPRNAGHSSLSGMEVAADWHDFARLSTFLEGIAVRANYTLLRGRLGIVNSDGTTRTIDALNQQPTYEANLILAYDRGPFNGSASWSWRGRAFNGVVGTTAAGDTYIAPYNSLNLRLGYRVTSQIQTYLSATNLTRSWWREQTGVNGRQFVTAIQDGIAIQLGAQFRF
jgi:TonB-dependent receptor